MGPDAAKNFVPAQELIGEYLATRIPEEFDTYNQEVILTDLITKRALSNEVITPGKTTVGDVRRWLYDEMWRNRVGTWFQPDLRVQRKGMPVRDVARFPRRRERRNRDRAGRSGTPRFRHFLHGHEHRLAEDGLRAAAG